MTVKTYVLAIFHQGHEKDRWEHQLDLDNEGRLRELLVSAAILHNRTPNVRDYAEWRLDVHKLEERRVDRSGPRLARVTLDSAGRTVVTR